MRALVTDDSAPGRIAIREVPEPVPGRDEVVVDVRAFSINRGEVRMLWTAPDGWRPGWDFAGVLRSDVEGGPRAGTRVVGIRQGETWAERVAVPADCIADIPDGVTFGQAAALATAGVTAPRILRLGPAILGRRVLVTGASGGVGRFAIQLAHLGGAEVTALVSGGSTRAAGLTELGADDGGLRHRGPAWPVRSHPGVGRRRDPRSPHGHDRPARDAGHVRQQLGSSPRPSMCATCTTTRWSVSRASSCSIGGEPFGRDLGVPRRGSSPTASWIHSSLASCRGTGWRRRSSWCEVGRRRQGAA